MQQATIVGQTRRCRQTRHVPPRRRALGLLGVLFGAAFGCARSADPAAPLAGKNLLLVSIDTLRADRAQPYGASVPTPHMQRLADEGVLFLEAQSPVPLTQPAHSTLFTGNYPARHGVRDNSDFVLAERALTLAERFQQAGYQTHAVVAAAVLAKRTGLDQGFDGYDDEFSAQQMSGVTPTVERVGAEVVERANAWIARREARRPFFLFVHFYDPHLPYAAPGEWSARFAEDAYAGEVAYADDCLGRLRAQLESSGLLDSTAIVLVSDHGESLGEHGEATHGLFLYEAALRVPMILRLPSERFPKGLRIETPVCLVDITPTVSELFGLETGSCDGASLVGLIGGAPLAERELFAETLYPLFYGWSPSFALRGAGHKFILAPRSELYHLADDPGEKNDLCAGAPERAAAFERRLAAQLERWSQLASDADRAQELASSRALAALGYASGSSAGVATAKLPDVKDRLAVYDELSLALKAMGERRWGQAKQRLERVLELDPGNVSALMNLGDVLARMGQVEQGIEKLEAALRLAPENRTAQAALGMLCFRAQRFDRARELLEALVQSAPKSAEPMYFLGQIHELRGEHQRALELYQRVEQLMPNAPGLKQRLQAVRKLLAPRS